MNTKILMATSSIVLGIASLVTLFVPQELLTAVGLPIIDPLPALIQLIGVLYFSFAMINWTAKNHAIGGIYSRPISLGNFAHFFIGTLVLAKDQLSNGENGPILVMMGVYALFAVSFWWLVFKHNGLVKAQLA